MQHALQLKSRLINTSESADESVLMTLHLKLASVMGKSCARLAHMKTFYSYGFM